MIRASRFFGCVPRDRHRKPLQDAVAPEMTRGCPRMGGITTSKRLGSTAPKSSSQIWNSPRAPAQRVCSIATRAHVNKDKGPRRPMFRRNDRANSRCGVPDAAAMRWRASHGCDFVGGARAGAVEEDPQGPEPGAGPHRGRRGHGNGSDSVRVRGGGVGRSKRTAAFHHPRCERLTAREGDPSQSARTRLAAGSRERRSTDRANHHRSRHEPVNARPGRDARRNHHSHHSKKCGCAQGRHLFPR